MVSLFLDELQVLRGQSSDVRDISQAFMLAHRGCKDERFVMFNPTTNQSYKIITYIQRL